MVKMAGLKIDANGLKRVGRGGMIQHTVAAKPDVHAYRVQNLKTITKKSARLKRTSDSHIMEGIRYESKINRQTIDGEPLSEGEWQTFCCRYAR